MSPLIVGLFLWAVSIAISDFRSRRIPNVWLLLVLVLQVLALVINHRGLLETTVVESLAGFTIGLVFFLPGYVLKISGAGDAKFAAVCGLLLGNDMMLTASLFIAAMMMVFALIKVLTQGWAKARHQKFPAGVAIAVGFVIAMVIPVLSPLTLYE